MICESVGDEEFYTRQKFLTEADFYLVEWEGLEHIMEH